MNIVLYTRDMEPVTIIDLPIDLLNWATNENSGYLRLAVPNPNPSCWLGGQYMPIAFDSYTVGIEFQRLILRSRVESWLAIVDNDEYALMLKPSWLPGQQAKINYYEKTNRDLAFALLEHMRK